MTKKIRRGRPAKPHGEKQSAAFTVYMTPADAKLLRADAKRFGTSPSALFAQSWRIWRESLEG